MAAHLFHLGGPRITYFPTGSGDTTLDYVGNFIFIVLALAAAIVWSLLDRKRDKYENLYAWLRVLVRLTLAMTLLNYGMVKIIPTQFRPPLLTQLVQPIGESSPMGLLWTFMGASTPYVIFSGLSEATAALLLLFRRTALLGTLLAAAVLLNVVMLNYCYDVPVKLYSTNLLLMALFLLIPDLSRLANIFFLNRMAEPAELARPRFQKRWMRIGSEIFKIALFGYFAVMSGWEGWNNFEQSRPSGEPPIYGVYEVDSLSRNGQTIPLSENSPASWRRVIGEHGFWAIRQNDGTTLYLQPRYIAKSNRVELYSAQTRSSLQLSYTQPDRQHLVLTERLGGEGGAVETHLHRIDDRQFLLTTRGYHWINEQPFNR